ncbi:MAG: pitrilysin family protein [Ignavibacteria bacterium]|jgi:predicted Zn-dependent peptidase
MKHKFFVILFIFLFTFNYSADRKKIEYVEYEMENGMHVILHQDNTTPIVAITTTFHVGSKNESPERTGFAHFFEHLMFGSTKHIKSGEYDKIVEGAGGANNAYTTQDKTFYYGIFPSNQLELGLWLESERMVNLTIDSTEVETQRKVVKEERRQRYDNQPYGTVIEETFKRAYKKHPYQWMPIGSMEHLDQASIEEFVDFHDRFYTPNNAVLSIAGDFDIEQTKEWVKKYYGTIEIRNENVYRPNISEPPLGGERRDIVYDNVQLPMVLQAYRIPEQGSEDFYALDMLSQVLASGRSSRLYKELVDKQQKAVQSGSFQYNLEDSGLFISYAISNAGIPAEDLETAMQVELEKVKNELIGEKEFEKLRNQIENAFVNSVSTIAGIAENLADYYVMYGDANLINNEIDKYMAVTRGDIQDVAKKYLNKDNRVVLYYLPKSEEKEG